MKKLGLLALCCLVLCVPALASSDLYVVVGDDAPTTDVVTAANFAGFMSANGHTFKSALESTQPAEGFMVFVDGDTVYLTGEFERKNTVEAYFTSEGFRVKHRDVQVQAMNKGEIINEIADKPVEQESSSPPTPPGFYDNPEPVQIVKNTSEPTITLPEVDDEVLVEEDKPNFIVRIFRWLFG